MKQVRTFKEWSYFGYTIKRGSKAVKFNNDGVALFNVAQVKPYVRRTYNKHGDYDSMTDFDRESDSEMADYYGISPWGNS